MLSQFLWHVKMWVFYLIPRFFSWIDRELHGATTEFRKALISLTSVLHHIHWGKKQTDFRCILASTWETTRLQWRQNERKLFYNSPGPSVVHEAAVYNLVQQLEPGVLLCICGISAARFRMFHNDFSKLQDKTRPFGFGTNTTKVRTGSARFTSR